MINSKLCLSTHWSAPDTNQCLLVVETIPDLDHIDVTPGGSTRCILYTSFTILSGFHRISNMIKYENKLIDVFLWTSMCINVSYNDIDYYILLITVTLYESVA